MASVDDLKNQGNKAFQAGDHPTAIKLFTQAIQLAPENHILYSNRSASYCSLKDYTNALKDAEKCVSLNGSWAKGYSRLGAALYGLGRYAEAEKVYSKGVELDPSNQQLKNGLEESIAAQSRSSGFAGAQDGMAAMNKLAEYFRDPNLKEKIAADPKTAPFLQEPDFLVKLAQLQANPNELSKFIQDKRFMQLMFQAMGANLDVNAMGGDDAMDVDRASASEPAPQEPKKEEKKPQPEPEPEPVEESEEEKAAKAAKQEALKEKELGNAAYKKRDFETAKGHYLKAWERDPTDITYLNNLAAVHFESGNLDECIKVCNEAVEKGRDMRANFQLVAKAFARMGNAYAKKDNLDQAIHFLGKSLAEHRTADVLTRLRELEKLRDKRKAEAYINPEIADQEREKGNALFKENKFAESIPHYTEAIKRNPKDPRAYSNRSAAYVKLMAVSEAMKDAEESIRLDPNFVKGYIRKANVLMLQKKFTDALTALQEAAQHDTDGKHATEIAQVREKASFALVSNASGMNEAEAQKRVDNDPEVQAILADPVMRAILEQMRTDPRALNEHMKSPVVAAKINKLIEAGVIRLG